MRLHLRPVPPQTSCDKATREALHRDLRMDIEERRISQEITDRHNDHIRRSRQFRLTGERD